MTAALRFSLSIAFVAASLFFGTHSAQAGGGPSGYVVVYDPSDSNAVTVANRYQQLRGIPERNMIPYPFPNVFSKSAAWDFVEALRAELASRGLSAQMQGIALLGPVPQLSSVTGGTANGTSIQSFLYLSPNYDRTTYPTSVLTPVNTAYRKPPLQPTATVAANRPIDGWTYWPVSYVGWTGAGGSSPSEVLNYLAKAKATDGSKPDGTVYWPVSGDTARNVRKSEIQEVVPMWRSLGMKYEVSSGNWVSGRNDVIGGILGVATIDPNQGGTTFLPGAWVDSLTSFGGSMSWDTGQIKATEWMRGGASGSSGTVSEPYNSPDKFTNGHIHTHFRMGSSLAEAFWQSIKTPAEIISLGDPLMQPFADFPSIAITAPANGASVNGLLNVLVTAAATGGKILETNLDLFVDGRKVAVGQGGESVQATRIAGGFSINTTSIGDGWHEIRAVAYNTDLVRTQSEASIGIVVDNGGTSLALAGPSTFDPDQPIALTVTPSGGVGLSAIQIRLNGRVLALLPPAGGSATISAGLLPYDGKCSVYAVGIKSAGGTLSSSPLEMTAAWPAQPSISSPGSGLGCVRVKYFASTVAPDFHWDRTPATTEVIYNGNGTDGLNLSTGSIPGITIDSYATNPGFEFDTMFYAPVADWYEFGCYAGSSNSWLSLDLTVNGRPVPVSAQLSRPVKLAPGWHRLRIRGINVTSSAPLALYERRSSIPVIQLVPASRLVSADGSPSTNGSGLPPQITAINGTANSKSFSLSVTANNPGGSESDLTYGWSMAAGAGTPGFASNGTNAAKTTTTGILDGAGNYTFSVYARNQWGTATSTVTVNMPQTATAMQVSGLSASQSLVIGQWYPVNALVIDQFGNPMTTQPQITWSLSNSSAEVVPISPNGGAAHVRALDSAATYNLTATGSGFSKIIGSLASAANTAPVFSAPTIRDSIPGTGGPGTGLNPFQVILIASGSDTDDLNKAELRYLWEVVSAPAGQTLNIQYPTGFQTYAQASGPGAYTIRATVTDGSGAAVTRTGSFTFDSDGRMGTPVVTVTATNPIASESGPTNGTFTITRSTTVGTDYFQYTLGGTASSADYQPLSGLATIPDGQSSVNITVTPVDDAIPEPDETVSLTLVRTYSYSYYVSTPAGATITITDNDQASTSAVVTVAATDSSASESASKTGDPNVGKLDTGVFTISRTGSTLRALAVSYNARGTATNGLDDEFLPGIAVIPAGQTSTTVVVTPFDDDEIEPGETVNLALAASYGYTLGASSSAVVNIADNDLPILSVTASDPTAWEEGINTGSFLIKRTGTTANPLTVNYTLAGAASAADYTLSPPGGTVTIPAGADSVTVTLTPQNDGVAEPSETAVMTLTPNASYAIGSPASDTVNITDTVPPTISIEATDATASEAGLATGEFTITRSGSTTDPLVVSYAVGGTATNGVDYETLPPTITIPAGKASALVTVLPKDDQTPEPSETVKVTLSPNSSYIVGTTNSATVTLLDDDLAADVWNRQDIGTISPGFAGSSSYDQATDTFTLRGSGAGITGAADAFYFQSHTSKLSGDGSIIARVDGITSTDSLARVGIMMRESKAPNSRFAMMAISPSDGVFLLKRINTGGTVSSTTATGVTAPRWLKLTRAGDQFTCAYSSDGVNNWTPVGAAQTVVMPAELEIGLCVTSGNSNASATAIFSGVSVNGNPGTGAVEIIMDNGDVASSGVAISSGWTTSTTTSGYVAANYITDGNAGKGTKTVRFTPSIPLAGNYAVYARWTAGSNRDTNVPIAIQYSGASTTTHVNEQSNGGTWQRLGGATALYRFEAGTTGYLEFSNTATTLYVIVDAVRFVREALPQVTISADDADAAEDGQDTGTFTITRAGSTSSPMTVDYVLDGTATNTLDYATLPTSVTIPAGQSSTSVVVIPVTDNIAEGAETVRLTLSTGNTYDLGASDKATVTIKDLPIDDWRFGEFGPNASNPAISGDGADPDADGISNLTEYALGLNPLLPSPAGLPGAQIETVDGVPCFTLTYRKFKTDVTYSVEGSSAMKAWDPVPDEFAGFENGIELRKAAVPLDDDKKILRLRVTRP